MEVQGRLVGWIRAVGSLVRVGELSKILEMLWNRKEGKGKKDFLKGGGGGATGGEWGVP